ncbi:hypothetical protein [Haloferula sp. A504]|uniref:hypothetical protein n=1 Tax=Haloferula sp. A504 TaxID=3373601 RepID=UPI0031C704B8|nr:hypothetical protein [Verrucomicrobiaceae bacterium E54]
MTSRKESSARNAAIIIVGILLAMIAWGFYRGASRPDSRRIAEMEQASQEQAVRDANQRDVALVRQLIGENLDERRFQFATVMNAASDKLVLPLGPAQPSHRRVLDAINASLTRATEVLSREGSPAREHRRINEVSRHFEDALQRDLDATEGLSCSIPTTREGKEQRSGYPDLRVVDEASGDVFYLDPKLVEEDSWDSSFRTFYFEPKKENLKINDDAVHLLVGIGHDGKSGEWTFGPWKVVDLSKITLRLKPEFQASNRDLYPKE